MKEIIISSIEEAVQFCTRKRPRDCICFVRPSGKPIAAWIVLAGIGELYTESSLKTKVRKRFVVAYNFWESIFSGVAYAKKKN
jgi:hypothetical protein